MMSQRMEFRILGTVEVAGRRGIRPIGGPKQRAVLAYLLLRAGAVISSERLIDAVWNGAPPAAARGSLHAYVSNLRRTLGGERIDGRSGGYVLHVDDDEVDAARFRSLVERAAATSPGRPTARAAVLGEALELWRGPALEDLAAEPAFRADAVALNELRATARDDWISARLAVGEYGAVVASVEALLDAEPLREPLWEQLMIALYFDGRQADALEAYQRARAVLDAELGIRPSPRLQRVQARVLEQQLSLEELYPPLRGYRLIERTHHGPLTTRYRARQPASGRHVEIEVIGPPLANDPTFVRRFDADAHAVSALRHRHVATLLDWWREPDAACLVTPASGGTTLAQRLGEGAVDRARSAQIVFQVREAIAAAHRRGIGHGALGPETVVIGPDGTVRVTGFAIGRVAQQDEATMAGDIEAIAAIATALGYPDERVGAADTDVRGPNPYKGLRMFREADAPDFFGRTTAVTGLVERLRSGTRFLAVVGPSGAGKSSLVRAGLIPALRRGALPGAQRWSIAVMVPGVAPFEDLAAALLSVARERETNLAARLAAGDAALGEFVRRLLADDELLLVIDQFEELFTTVSEDDRDAFVAGVLAAVTDQASRLRVVVTLRADFFDRPLHYDVLGQLLASHTEVVVPLTPAEVARAITGPAERAGVTVEPALVAQMVRDVADQPGALPLLQYALTEMYEGGGDRLTADDYRAVGGLVGALAQRADQVLSDLPPPARDAARQVFLRSVTLGEGAGDVRRRVRRSELVELAVDAMAMDRAIDAFGSARLLTSDRDAETREPTVEIAHEALLTRWRRLRGWIDTARDELVTERQLATATREWRAAGRDASFLATGHRLDRFDELAAGSSVAITGDERAYLDASRAERRRLEDEQAARREQHERLQRRSLRRLRALLAVLTVAALTATALTAFAVQQRNSARREARVASARELSAAALANLEVDPQRSLLLGISAVERTRQVDGTVIPPAEDALHRAVQASRLITTVEDARGPVAWSPSGDMIATGSVAGEGVMQIRDASTFDVITETAAHDAAVTGVAFSGDGSRVATTADDGVVRLWDVDTGAQRHEVVVSSGLARAPAFSPDGGTVTVALPDDDAVAVVDAELGTVTRRLETRGSPLTTAVSVGGDIGYDVATTSPSEDGQRADSQERAVVVARAGGRVRFRTGTYDGLRGIAFSPDGRLLATAAEILDAGTGVPLTDFEVDPGIAPSWSADGQRLATGGVDGTVVVRRVTDAGGVTDPLTLVAPDSDAVFASATIAPDGSVVVTVDDSGRVHAWDAGAGASAEVATLPADDTDWPTHWPGMAWAPDARRLAVSAGDGDVAIWRTDTWTVTSTLSHGNRANVNSIAWSPDGRLVATVGRGRARVWEVDSGNELFVVPYTGLVGEVTWSPDRRHLAVVGGRTAVVVDRTGAIVTRIPSVPGEVWGVTFNGDGTLLGLALDDAQGVVDVWDWRLGELVASFEVGLGSVAFDPTQDRLVAVDRGGARLLGVDQALGGTALEGDVQPFNDVAFSPDGRLVASAGSGGVVRLWDPDSGDEVLALHGHSHGVDQVRFSPDGRWLASSSTDDGVRVWALRIEDLLGIAHGKVTRSLTTEECEQYLHDPSCA